MNRVVVTGIGAVTPLGIGFKESWHALLRGDSGIEKIRRFDASNIPWKVSGEIKSFIPEEFLSKKETRRYDLFIQYALASALIASKDSGFSHPDSCRVKLDSIRAEESHYLSVGGVIVGSSRGGISSIEKTYAKRFLHKRTDEDVSLCPAPYLMPSTTVSMASSVIAQKFGLKGHCLGISNACASGTNAIGEAFRLVKHGYPGPIFAGGAEAPICRICIEGYGTCGALSKQAEASASRPFTVSRDGFVLSEGACILVLENYEKAMRRNARIYGEIIGYGNSSDAFHITRPDPHGEARAIVSSLTEGDIKPETVDFINTHGTSTKIGDSTECKALDMVFGKRIIEIPASASKSSTGHMLGASGAFEAAVTLMSMKEGIIPPTLHSDEKDPVCPINIRPLPQEAEIKFAISNSFGFGGTNAVLLMRKL